jgi:hypothetical protein
LPDNTKVPIVKVLVASARPPKVEQAVLMVERWLIGRLRNGPSNTATAKGLGLLKTQRRIGFPSLPPF